jgi:hypothetical protein
MSESIKQRLSISFRCLTNDKLRLKLRFWKALNVWTPNVPTYFAFGQYRVFTGYLNPRHNIRGGGSPTERYQHLWWRLFKVAEDEHAQRRWANSLREDCAEFRQCSGCGQFFYPAPESISAHFPHRHKRFINLMRDVA